MTSVLPVVEGFGDVAAVPALIGRAAAHFGKPHYCLDPIRAGEYRSLRRDGELERYLELALTRSPDTILIALDLDDDCPATEFASTAVRVAAWRGGRTIPVGICFFKCEYESLFLSQIDSLFGQPQPGFDPESIRGAKGMLHAYVAPRYKETRDQLLLTRRLDINLLDARSRSFRKLRKELSL